MKQTVTINLAGIVYHIDEDAYEILNAYLKSIESHLEDSDSKTEIMQDIEARIAELFSQHLKFGHIEVVNINLVNDVTAQLGSPEMITDGEEASEETETANGKEANTTSEPQPAQPARKKRFYRDTDHQVIGGVCSGLAQLIGIDVVWVRLVVALLLFLEGIGFFLYLLLWLIVPAANTAARRLEMRGEEPSAENIKAEVERLRENVDENGNLKQQNKGDGPWGCLKVLVIAIACICCFPFIVAIFGVVFGLVFGGMGALMGVFPGTDLGGVFSSFAFGALAAILTILIPIIVLIVWAIHRNRTNEPMAKGFWTTSIILWLISFICLFIFGINFCKSIGELEGNSFEEKMENLGERLERIFENMDEDATIVVNGDTITFGQAKQMIEEGTLEDSILMENLEQLDDEFGDGASEGVLEVTEE